VTPEPEERYEKLVQGAGGLDASLELVPLSPIESIPIGLLTECIASQGLQFGDDRLPARIHAALSTGKHLLLQGPPGTGKTELAIAIAKAAAVARVCRGHSQIAGSSDWTPADTIGTYRLTRTKDLEFSPGLILDAVRQGKWVVLDELNRAAIDQAMGPFFTVLSGQSVVLRFEQEDAAGDLLTVAIVPENSLLGDRYLHYEVPSSWRIIATMNTLDVDLLFEISQAFLRRFAVLDVNGPPTDVHAALLSQYATGQAEIDVMVLRLPRLPGAPLGPAITIDCARYVRSRAAGGETDHRALADELMQSFIRPQLAHLSPLDQEAVRDSLAGPPPPAAQDAQGGQ
jgi:DNA polymerase III delta prime subunit